MLSRPRLRSLAFLLVVRPLLLLVLGLNVRHPERLRLEGPAILVANHNSHLDALVLITLFPHRLLPKLRPVAAADYFLRNRWLAWFALDVIGIIPLEREVRAGSGDPLGSSLAHLDAGGILILFPEGSRGEPERLSAFKTGVAHLARRRPAIPIIPIFLHGLGKALPKGEGLLVPFIGDVFVGAPLRWSGERGRFMADLDGAMQALASEGRFPHMGLSLAVAAAWGFAEATLFFIVPDVWLSVLVLRFGLARALAAALAATVGAMAGGAVMYAWASWAPGTVLDLLDRIPAIGPAMLDRARQALAESGLPTLVAGAFQGIPYKVFVALAPEAGIDLGPLLVASVPARLARFVPVCLFVAAVASLLPRSMGVRARLALLGGLWLLFYTAFFMIMPGSAP